MEAEGWYVDPYRRHNARWFSNGTPTDLVCDGKESKVPRPEAPHAGSFEALQGAASSDEFAHGDKVVRAGAGDGIDALRDGFVESGVD